MNASEHDQASAKKGRLTSALHRVSEAMRTGRKRLLVLGILGLIAAGCTTALYVRSRARAETSPAESHSAAGQKSESGETYYCPMHTQYKSDKPGNCPICSMKLVKLETPSTPGAGQTAGETQAMPGMPMGAESAPGEAAPAPNAIFIAPQRQQLIGAQSVPASVRPLVKEIRAVGKVAYDETKVTHIHTKVTGYIEEVFVNFVGRAVKKGEPLFTIYSPDLLATQEEYLLALKSRETLKDSSFPWIAGGSNNLLEAARRRLRLWDISEAEIEALEKEGKVKRALTIHSPVNGIVTERMAYHHGRYVNPEMDLYTIVDLSTVWVLAEVYEYEIPFVKVGQTAEIESPYISNTKPLLGKVTFIYPYLNPKTRTTQVRMEFSNRDLALRPDMFFNVRLRASLGSQLVVPEDSVLDTGTEQYVFVDKGEGYFEPRLVKVGAEARGFYAIESGLKAGEKVVTAANFILDSESRLKGVFANMGPPARPEPDRSAAAPQRLSVEILEPRQATTGRNALRLMVKDASGNPVEGAQVEVTLSMPQMGTMPAMTSQAVLQDRGGGVYEGTIEIPIAWTWQATVTVRKGASVLGTVQSNITVR